MQAEYGKKYDGRPNDLISWLLELAPAEECTVDKVLRRILGVNMAAIHTSSNSLYQSLLNLATHPEYVAPMCQEVLSVTQEHGWTKAAMSSMHKVDSFLKESIRYEGISGLAIHRKVIKKTGYTFSNGLHLPYGTWINIPTFSVHHDAQYYEDPFEFDSFRFSKIGEGDELKHQMVSTNLQYLAFGHGKHACPGRFFAAAELKVMLAYLLVTYEMKLESEPKSFWLGPTIAPDPNARVLFRRMRK